MTGCSGASCGGSCRLRRRCRPALAAATDGGASSRWANIVCRRSDRLLQASSSSSNSISSTAATPAEETGPSSTRRADIRCSSRRTRLCSTAHATTASTRTMNWKRLPSSPSSRAFNPASSLTDQPDRPWPTDPESFQVKKKRSSPNLILYLVERIYRIPSRRTLLPPRNSASIHPSDGEPGTNR